jgi:hypothetical protein
MAKQKHRKVPKDATENLVGAAYAYIHDEEVRAQTPLIQGVREALENNDENTLSVAIMTLMIKDQEVAREFVGLCNRHACMRFGERHLTDSTLMGIPLGHGAPITLSEDQVRRLTDWLRLSEIICQEGRVCFYPKTVNLINLVMSHPCEIYSLHDAIPAQTKLPKQLTEESEYFDEGMSFVQVLLMTIVEPADQEDCWNWRRAEEQQADFTQLISDVLFDGRPAATPPLMLSDIISRGVGTGNDEEPVGNAAEFSDALMGVILDLGTSELDAEIDEPDHESLKITLCNAGETCRSLNVAYGSIGLSRSEAFMMVYDVMKRAGVLGIMLNEEVDDLDMPYDFPPDNVVRH